MKRTALRRKSRLSRTGSKWRTRESLDSADRKLLHFRFNRCERCGESRKLDLHHIVSRRVLAVRHERENHLALCRDCHRWWHDSPKRARAWLESRWPGRLEALKAAAAPIRVGSERAEALEAAKRLRATAGRER